MNAYLYGVRACLDGKPADSSIDIEFIDNILMHTRLGEGYRELQQWLDGYNQTMKARAVCRHKQI